MVGDLAKPEPDVKHFLQTKPGYLTFAGCGLLYQND